MRSIQSRKKSFFIALTVLSASLYLTALTVACGGGKPDGDVKSPGSSGGGSEGASSGAGSSGGGPTSSGAVSSGGASGGMTTTTALPDHTEVESKGDGGPKAGPGHSQEPGRRRDDIQTIILVRRDEARACYDKGLKDHPGIEGDLTVKFTIDPQGTVTEASVDSSKSTINEPTVGNCIIEIIKKVKFAPSKLGFETRASYPYNFHPKTFGKADAGGAK